MKHAHTDVEPLLAGYALEALTPEEAHVVEDHLKECDRCPAILDEYQAVTSGLLHTPRLQTPPGRVRARLLSRVVRPAPKPSLWDRVKGLGWSRAAVGAVLGALLIVNLLVLGQNRAVASQQQALTQRIADQQTAFALITYPTTKITKVYGDGYGTFVYDPGQPIAVLNAWGLSPLPAAQTYQVWLVSAKGDRVSGGLFQVLPGARFTTLVINSPSPLSSFVGVGVTVEPAGGSPAPTGPRVLRTDF
jgi:anti-sigma-K factor RskA